MKFLDSQFKQLFVGWEAVRGEGPTWLRRPSGAEAVESYFDFFFKLLSHHK